jgi:hypothetical protein
MDANDPTEPPAAGQASEAPAFVAEPPASSRSPGIIPSQATAGTCTTCGSQSAPSSGNSTTYPYVYAIGGVQHSFPSLGDEKEFAQVTGRSDTTGMTDQQARYQALSQHRYLARRGCYVLTIGGMETYILQPRDPMDLDLLVEAVRPKPSPMDLDAIVGVRGPLAPPEMCNGLMVPIVMFDQLYSFDRASLQKNIPRPKNIPQAQFLDTAEALLDRILQIADNAGATNEDRALNYLAMRYERIYSATAEAYGRNASLTSIDVRPSALSGTRELMDVIFSYTDRTIDVVDKLAVRVDVTEEFPFLVTKLSPYVDR